MLRTFGLLLLVICVLVECSANFRSNPISGETFLDPYSTAQLYCGLYIQFDDGYLNLMENAFPNAAMDNIARHMEQMTRSATHVFRNSGTLYVKNVHFYVKKIRSDSIGSPRTLKTYLFSHGVRNPKEYCVVLTLTAFDDLGHDRQSLGISNLCGVCARRMWTENTMAIAIINVLKQEVTTRIFLHELGHLFGADHDGTSNLDGIAECPLKGENLVMYPYVQGTVDGSSRHFSRCSLQRMRTYMRELLDSGDLACFEPFKVDYCGNEVVDEGEVCDCGATGEDCLGDGCCSNSDNLSVTQCSLVDGNVTCSPSNGDCCDPVTCNLRQTNYLCSQESDCLLPAFCREGSNKCPKPIPKPDGTLCGNATCLGGVCLGSLCRAHGLESCIPSSLGNYSTCLVYCKKPEGICDKLCKFTTSVHCTMTMAPGSLCGEGLHGICNFLGTCQRQTAIEYGLLYSLLRTALCLLAFAAFYCSCLVCLLKVVPKNSYLSSSSFCELEERIERLRSWS